MTGHILWFFDNTFASAATQQDIGPFNPGSVTRIFRAAVHGELAYQSSLIGHPFVSASDLLWGLQYVAHGASPLNALTSGPNNQWLWRQNVSTRSDTVKAFAPSSATGVSQGANSLFEEYSSQGNKPGGNIDVYLSVVSVFGIAVAPILLLGSIDFLYD